jgi:uncharacterized membrane protein
MRSWGELAIAALLGACGTDTREPDDTPDACETTFVDYATVGRPFMLDWCTGCHSSTLPPTMRQDAPLDVNFDDHAAILVWGERIRIRAAGPNPTMPPAGGPSDEERALIAEWIDCGAR